MDHPFREMNAEPPKMLDEFGMTKCVAWVNSLASGAFPFRNHR
jgi:hypothetical protein